MMIMITAAALAAAQPAAPAPDMHAQHAMGQMDNMSAGKHEMNGKCCCDDMDKDHEEGMHHGESGHR